MSIKDNKEEFEKALEQAHKEYPMWKNPSPKEGCNHDYSFVVFCDGGAYDIVRCRHCGDEIVTRCTFDDDYD